ARENRARYAWRAEALPRPAFTGRREVEGESVATLVPYIDWTFFFSAWELNMKFPKILDDPRLGAAARELYAHGRTLLDRIAKEELLRPRGAYGFWPANADGEDLVLWTDASRGAELARFPMLRQQGEIADGKPNRSLVDYVAPVESGLVDHVGAFCVTAGHGVAELVAEFQADHDDYHAILTKALADRLAEAFAERLHERVRREWGYAADETLSNEELIDERYRGIRPAFGYPACPDHRPKRRLLELLDAESVGVTLTESMAMAPAASVSGLYLAHEDARYFNVGRLGRDQVEDYARRTRASLAETERWLGPSLGYEPRA
ncbi:MAG TPA: vitamin B12 dependent-methionine synthase activation domain-containing protein, partial [Planctomycetota bacterium]|nr:vitamin B12 dependent-methionine synthase activation domain-containing protein [Planctomycetota bacterium]